MDAIPLFLNDGSFPSLSNDELIEEEVLELLRTLKRLKALDRPFVVGVAIPLSGVPLTSAYRTLANFAAIDREWWRFIKALDQKSPFAAVPQSIPPDETTHIVTEGPRAVAPLWAAKNDAFVVSLPSRVDLRDRVLTIDICDCVCEPHAAISFDVRNMSLPNHVDSWRDALLDFNYVESASSTIFESDMYRLKMYLHDHDPPHVHVYEVGNFRKCVGRIRFDFVEVMEDNGFDRAVRKQVLELLNNKQRELLRAWDRCRSGSLPNRID